MSGTRSRLIGRSDDLAAVGATLGLAVREQRVTGVIVTGDPGMGKTRLLQEGSAVAEHGCTFHISGFELDRNVSLASAAPMLRELAGSPAAGGRLHEILAVERAGRPLEPLRVFEAAAEAVAHVGPALIVFDDIQWADDASIALCRYLLRAAQSDGAVLSMLAAGRPGKKTDAFLHAVRDLLGEDLAEIDLGPLPFADAETLALAVAPSLSGAEAAELARVSGGMPFWIEVLARRPLGEGDPTDAISRRLKGLGTDAAEALALLVVASRPLRAADLEQALSWPPERADTAITDLADRGLVTLSGAALRIAHDLIRERAAAQLPESDRARHHRSLAEWLQRDAGDDIRRQMEALEHGRAAGTPSVALAIAIATSPNRRLLGREALASLGEIADAASAPQVMDLRRSVASLAAEIGEREAAFDRWAALARDAGTVEQRASGLLEAARAGIDLQRSAAAADLLARARDEGASMPWVQVEADALDHLRLAWIENDSVAAAAVMRRAIDRARTLVAEAGVDALSEEQRRSYIEALRAEHDVALMGEDLEGMARTITDWIDASRGFEEEHLIARASLGTSMWYLARFQEAAKMLQDVLDDARRRVLPALVAEVSHPLAYTHYLLGDVAEAMALLDDAARLEQRLGSPSRRAIPWVRGGLHLLIEASTGDWRGSVEALRVEAASYPEPHNRLRFHQWAATCAARLGGREQRDVVLAEIEAALDDASAAGCTRCHSESVLSAAELCARVGEPERAAELIQEWDAAHQAAGPLAELWRLRAEAGLAAEMNRGDALELLERLAGTAGRYELRVERSWALTDLGVALVETDRARAKEVLSEALSDTVAMGTRAHTDLVMKHLRALGVRRPAPAALSAGIASLSRREAEVARLVAGGARNAEIATSLFVSPKTVERHVSNIFVKLGVRNRAELASRLAPGLRPD